MSSEAPKSPEKGSQSEDWVKRYELVRPLHVQFTEKLETLIRDMLRAQSIDFHLLESRTKKEVSFKEKIHRASKRYIDPLDEVTDLSGIRIITYYQEDSELIGRLIESEFAVDNENSYTPSVNPSEFGYKSTHFVVSLTPARGRLLEWKNLDALKAEIQVRTVLQHAWAAISHKLQYKREEDIPNQLKRKLFRLSALFELADEEFVALKNASGQLSYVIGQRLSAGERDIEIDYLSVQKFVDQSPEVAEFSASAAEAGFSFDDPGYDEYDSSDSVSDLVVLMRQLDLQSIEQLETTLRKAVPWSAEYLVAQFTANQDDKSSGWNVTPAFICQLILIGTFPEKIRLGHLLKLGWNKKIANRVLHVVQHFSPNPRGIKGSE